MLSRHWALALPLVLAASITSTHAATIRDSAGMFSADAVRQAQSRLDRLEQDTRVPVTIETIDSLDGRDIVKALPERAKENRAKGLYVLIAKKEGKIDVQSSREYSRALTTARNNEVENAFIAELKKRDFNAGLNRGVEAIESVLTAAKADAGGAIRAAAPAARGGPAPRARQGVPAVPGGGGGGFGLSSLLGIGLLILAVLFGIRLLGSLFGGGNRGYAGPQRMGGPGQGPGYGAPGYGGAGGGGGGFMSSMFGGIGGALAGNWLYDQFSGRSHGGHVDQSSMGTGAEGGALGGADAGTEWGGSDGGGDWGGDAGGGGDWGGGGGGGDWGGGGGGGDWGGGGDGGGGGGDW